jgi:serpin B
MRRKAGPLVGQAGHAASRLAAVLVIAIAGCAGAIPSSFAPGSAPSPASPSAPSALPSASEPSALPSTRSIPPGTGEIVLAMSDVAREETSPADAKAAGGAVTAFGLDLYREFVTPDENAVISPASILIALGMARVGARGETATEMDTVMHEAASDDHAAWLNALDRALASRTKGFPGYGEEPQKVTLRIANTQFAQQGLHLEQDYLDALAARYGAGLNLVDYASDPEAVRKLINGWVNDQTEDRIPELLSPGDVNESTILTLVNATYLKAAWLYPFSLDQTKDGTFTRADGSTVEVPMMRLKSDGLKPAFETAVTDDWQAIELPYVGGELSMLVVIPKDLAAFEEGLDEDRLADVDASLEQNGVDLELPKFGIESKAQVAALLGKLGMPMAFSGEADFSGIFGDGQSVPIARVVHQANIDVDEIGTEAAAATAVGFDTSGGPSPEPLVIHADRPFLFALRDVETGAILFLGRVADPSIER